MLQWLLAKHESVVVWILHMMDAAAAMSQLDVLQWLCTKPKNQWGYNHSNAFRAAVRGGHLDTVK